MRILLCLPSGQHIANFLSVLEFRPDRLILPAGNEGRRALAPQRLLSALNEAGVDYRQRHDVEVVQDEFSIAEFKRVLQAVYDRYPASEWIVNLAGGTKLMAIATYEFFSSRRATFVYTNAARPDVYQILNDGTSGTWSCHPSIRQFLAGFGFTVLEEKAKRCAAEREARRQWDCARLLALWADPEDLVLLQGERRKEARKGKLCLEPRDCGKPFRNRDIRDAVAQTFRLDVDGDAVRGKLSKEAGRFLTGEWLETFFWNLLDRKKQALRVWDTRLGLQVASANGVPNQYDVVFMHRYNLNLLECKTGTQEDNPAADVLYKIEAVAEQLQATRVRKFLATTAREVVDATRGPGLRKRAALYGCTIISSDQIRDLAAQCDCREAICGLLGL